LPLAEGAALGLGLEGGLSVVEHDALVLSDVLVDIHLFLVSLLDETLLGSQGPSAHLLSHGLLETRAGRLLRARSLVPHLLRGEGLLRDGNLQINGRVLDVGGGPLRVPEAGHRFSHRPSVLHCRGVLEVRRVIQGRSLVRGPGSVRLLLREIIVGGRHCSRHVVLAERGVRGRVPRVSHLARGRLVSLGSTVRAALREALLPLVIFQFLVLGRIAIEGSGYGLGRSLPAASHDRLFTRVQILHRAEVMPLQATHRRRSSGPQRRLGHRPLGGLGRLVVVGRSLVGESLLLGAFWFNLLLKLEF